MSNVYMNRELSWLKFNERVLEEAENPEVPLCERMTFVSIYQSNLDEFFRVRVGSLQDQMLISTEIRENKTKMTSAEQIRAIIKEVKKLNQRKDIGSADFMTRNTVKRVEVAAPVYSERLKKRLQDLFDLMLSDNKKARKEDAKGTYSVVECKGQPINSQELLYQEAYAKAAVNSSNQLEAAVQQTENKVIE